MPRMRGRRPQAVKQVQVIRTSSRARAGKTAPAPASTTPSGVLSGAAPAFRQYSLTPFRVSLVQRPLSELPPSPLLLLTCVSVLRAEDFTGGRDGGGFNGAIGAVSEKAVEATLQPSDITANLTMSKTGTGSSAREDGAMPAVAGLTRARSDHGGRCAVWKEDVRAGDALEMLACRHYYHACCAHRWLRVPNRCPVCDLSVHVNVD